MVGMFEELESSAEVGDRRSQEALRSLADKRVAISQRFLAVGLAPQASPRTRRDLPNGVSGRR
jgi:hypothetical protein